MNRYLVTGAMLDAMMDGKRVIVACSFHDWEDFWRIARESDLWIHDEVTRYSRARGAGRIWFRSGGEIRHVATEYGCNALRGWAADVVLLKGDPWPVDGWRAQASIVTAPGGEIIRA